MMERSAEMRALADAWDKMDARTRRGQTSVDYILVLAVVLLIGLIALGLSGTWPDLALNSRNQQSVTFWRDQARPITIPEAYYNYRSIGINHANFSMLFQTQIDEPLVLAGIFIDGVQRTMSDPVSGNYYCSTSWTCNPSCACNLALNPRGKVRVTVGWTGDSLGSQGCRANGQIVRVPVSLVYYRPTEPNRNLSENTTIDLAATCIY